MKNIVHAFMLLCVITSIAIVFPSHGGADTAIDQFIGNLQYNPKILLSLKSTSSSESFPARSSSSNGVIICSSKDNKIPPQGDSAIDDITVFNPAAGVVFPGALLIANAKLAEGQPTLISLPRSSVTISVDLPGMTKGGVMTIKNYDYSSFQQGMNKILDNWFSTSVPRGYVNAADSQMSLERAYSNDQLALALGFVAEWAKNKVSTDLNFKASNEQSTTVAFFKQRFYTITANSPNYPSDVFAPGVTVNDLNRLGISNDAPPAYIKSVNYGRLIFIRMDTRSSAASGDLKAALTYVTSTKITGKVDTRFEKILKNSSFKVVTIGGNPSKAAKLSNPDKFDELYDVISANAIYDKDNPGVPISYTVAFLKNNEIAAIRASTNYRETNCVEYPNGYVKLRHGGGYVARFFVNWTQKDENGKSEEKSYNSGNKTAGWSYTVQLPGDATNVRLRAEAATGLVWDPWGEIFSITEYGPTNKCYRAKGTTLHRRYDNDCN